MNTQDISVPVAPDLSSGYKRMLHISQILRDRFYTDGVIRPGSPKYKTTKAVFSQVAIQDPIFMSDELQCQLGLYYEELRDDADDAQATGVDLWIAMLRNNGILRVG